MDHHDQLGATLAARAKYVLPHADNEAWDFLHELDAKEEMTVRCTLLHRSGEDWTFTGPAEAALAQARSHRWHHESWRRRLAERKKPQKQAAAPVRR